jgi:hypothetical protein
MDLINHIICIVFLFILHDLLYIYIVLILYELTYVSPSDYV